MPQPRRPSGIEEGMPVITVDGQQFGVVVGLEITDAGLGPESGMFEVLPTGSPDRISVPFSLVREVQRDRILLDVTAEEVFARAWGPERGS